MRKLFLERIGSLREFNSRKQLCFFVSMLPIMLFCQEEGTFIIYELDSSESDYILIAEPNHVNPEEKAVILISKDERGRQATSQITIGSYYQIEVTEIRILTWPSADSIGPLSIGSKNLGMRDDEYKLYLFEKFIE